MSSDPIRVPKPRGLTIRRMAFLILLCAVGFSLIAYVVGNIRLSRWADTTYQCSSNLGWINSSLAQYHEKYGHYPPAYVADKNGNRLHSWRVLLLEFEDPTLYNAYNFNEPWNGPNNRKLAYRLPSFYSCPNDYASQSSPPRFTNYLAVVGEGTMFPGDTTTSKSDVPKNHRAVLIVELANTGISWMEPRDLELGSISLATNDPAHPSKDYKGPAVIFSDHTTERLGPEVTPDSLRAMTTIPRSDEHKSQLLPLGKGGKPEKTRH